MKRLLCLFVLAALMPAFAADFVGITAGKTPAELARAGWRVVGQMGNGIIVAGSGRDATVLAADLKDREFYRVRLFDASSRPDLAAAARILNFDGVEYLVEIPAGGVDALMAIPARRALVNLNGWVFDAHVPALPRVLSNPLIQQMVDAVNPDTILAGVRRLQNFRNRYSTGDSCRAACNWIAQKYRDYGCDSVFLEYHVNGHAPNVIALKYGTRGQRNPYAIIDGHIDSYAASNAPGADDNASGTIAALEACRVMRDYRFENDLRFIAFSGEEFGLYGSDAYATRARARGDTILGVINYDMIAYVDAAPEELEVIAKIANPACGPFADFFIACSDTYTTLISRKQMVSDNQSSDQGPFWNNGYLAFCGIEDFWPTNPHYHTSHDSIGAGYNDNAWCTEVTRAGVAALATLGGPVPLNQPLVGIFSRRIDDAAGNQNGRWDAAESIGLRVTLRNAGTITAHAVTATISTADPYVTLYNTGSAYGDIAGLDTAAGSLPFTMRAAPGTPREHQASFDLTIVATETTWLRSFTVQIGEYLITDPVPDGPRTPALYWAFDDVDSGYVQRPTYDWVEVNGIGTRINFSQNDAVVPVTIPIGFGPVKFYGQRYTQVSVSADGWIAMGNYTTSNYSNTALPSASAPPAAVFANWDDLYPVSGSGGAGNVYWYHDAAGGRFIVEYDSVGYYGSTSTRDKFEVIFYDTTQAAPDGNTVIVVQYKTAVGFTGSTVGIQDQVRTVGIQDLYNGTLARGAAPIAPGRAIRFTTDATTGIAERPLPAPGSGPRLSIDRNPVNGRTRVRFALGEAGPAEVTVFDRAGRRLEALLSGPLAPGEHVATWDASHLAPGVYFVRLTAGGLSATVKAVVAR